MNIRLGTLINVSILVSLVMLASSTALAATTFSNVSHDQDFKDGDTLTITTTIDSDQAVTSVDIFHCESGMCLKGVMRDTGGGTYEFKITPQGTSGGDASYSTSTDLKYRLVAHLEDGSSANHPSDDPNDYIKVHVTEDGGDGDDGGDDSPGFEGALLIGIMLLLTFVASKSASRFRGK